MRFQVNFGHLSFYNLKQKIVAICRNVLENGAPGSSLTLRRTSSTYVQLWLLGTYKLGVLQGCMAGFRDQQMVWQK